MAVAAIAVAGLSVSAGVPLLAVGSLPLAGLGYFLVVTRRREVGAALAMAALDRSSRGRFEEARALLDAVSPNVLSSYVGMMVSSQRAALALYEGDLETAVAEATRGVRDGRRLDAVDRVHQSSALSIRAVALAGLGRKEEALSDVARVRAATLRQGRFMARAALAEALIFAREKDLDALGDVLRTEGRLLFGATGPRERMIARALSRLVAARKVSVYREPAKRDEGELDEHASWVARIAPEAASFAKAPKLGARLEAPQLVDPKVTASAEKAAPQPKASKKRLVAVWALLVVLFLAIWQLLPDGASRDVDGPPVEAPAHLLSLPAYLVLGLVAWAALMAAILAVKVVRSRKLAVELSAAMELRLRGRHDEAHAVFERLAESKVLLVAPQARRELATIATSAGDFRSAQRHAAAGIAATRSNASALSLSRPILLPQLHAELAFAMAAAGDAVRAEEELETLRTLSPAYPYLAQDTFRVRLVALASSGRLDEAAAMARERPVDLPLSMQDELLCDALRLRAGDQLPQGERERIELDLRDDALIGRFIDCVAPTLRSSLHEKGPRIATPELETMESEDEPEPEAVSSRVAARLPSGGRAC